MDVIAEIQRRNIFRAVIAYGVFCWILIQMIDIVGPVFDLPEAALRITIIALLGLFPFVLVFSWIFKWTPSGLLRHAAEQSGSTNFSTAWLNTAIVSLLLVALILVVLDAYVLPEGGEAKDSIAVLPFANLSGDTSQDYFSDGLSEELLNVLARIEGLKVAARTSSFAYKGQNQDIRSIGEALGVDTVLEGSVRQSGNRIRVTAQLINIDDGYHLWSSNFDRELTDIFEIQDEIASNIVNALRLHLDTGDAATLPGARETSLAAYDKYLQGLGQEKRFNYKEALELYREATNIDPGFAKGWAGRARVVVQRRETLYWGDIPPEEVERLATTAIDRALSLDPDLPEALVARGIYQADKYHLYDEAMVSFKQALEINPNDTEALTWLADLQERTGEVRQAMANLNRALDLDPQNMFLIRTAAQIALMVHDENLLERAKELMPAARKEWFDTFAHARRGKPNLEIYQRIMADDDYTQERVELMLNWTGELDRDLIPAQSRFPDLEYAWMLIQVGEYQAALALINSLPEELRSRVLSLEELSGLYAVLGDCESSLAAIEQAHGKEAPVYGFIPVNAQRSNLSLALSRASCLRELGRTEESQSVLNSARRHVDTLRANADCCYAAVDAKLRIIDGDVDGAARVVTTGLQRRELDRFVINRHLLDHLKDDARVQAAIKIHLQSVMALREELGLETDPDLAGIY